MTFSSSPLSKSQNRLPLSKPKAHHELAPPGMGEVGQVGELSGNFQPKRDALISAGNIDAATHAGTDGAGANNGKLNDGRFEQSADAVNAETARCRLHRRSTCRSDRRKRLAVRQARIVPIPEVDFQTTFDPAR